MQNTAPQKNDPRQYGDHDDHDCGCKENNTLTQKTINNLRKKYCDDFYTAKGEVTKWYESYVGQKELYQQKKCMFLWTEENYRIYRNMEISVGTQLIQSNALIKTNVSNYIKWSNDLSVILKSIFAAVKDAKGKFDLLLEQKDKLDRSLNDSCNSVQKAILTGKPAENCKDGPERPHDCKDLCSDAEQILEQLLCVPKGLGFDIDSIFKSSSEVIGIQVFSNLNTLGPLQADLEKKSGAFDQLLITAMQKRETDLKTAQKSMVSAVQEMTKSESNLDNKLSDLRGLKSTVKELCCPTCECVYNVDPCDPRGHRLHKCERDICDICGKVKDTFCTPGTDCKPCNDKKDSLT